MTEPGDFLSRWSRRKRDAGKESAEAEAGTPPDDTVVQPVEGGEQAALPAARDGAETGESSEEPAFDLSKLPSLESITAETDIRPFLAAGVPASLRQAALRRAWSADPKIRDFIGIAENQWDFTGDSELLGFDFSPPSGDVRKMVAELFGEKSKDDPVSRQEAAASDGREDPGRADAADQIGATGNSDDEPMPEAGNAAPDNAMQETVQDTGDAALQNDDAAQKEKIKLVSRRSHGSAMPK